MATSINTEILISASVQKVWDTLLNVNDYPNWNPFIKKIEGTFSVGNTIKIELANGMKFKPKVLTCTAPKELKWLGHLIFKGLFDGEHSFELIEIDRDTTLFKHSEKFSGALVPFFKKQINVQTRSGFEMMNNKLKQIVEKQD